jgi:uridine kinase
MTNKTETGDILNSGRSYHVVLNDVKFQAKPEDRFENFLYQAPHKGDLAPLGVIANNKLVGLARRITSDCTAFTIDYGSKEGAFIYRRTACLILYAAVRNLYPESEVFIGQAILGGYFFEISGLEINAEATDSIKEEMKDLVRENIRIEFKRVYVDEAVQILDALGYEEKKRWVLQVPRDYLWMVELAGFYDLLHGPLAPSTGAVDTFALHPYRHGFVLSFPNADKSFSFETELDQGRLFETFTRAREAGRILGVSNVAQLTDVSIKGEVSKLIRNAEALFIKRILGIADEIVNRKDEVKIVLISGPSSSGKTTFSKRLGVFLHIQGLTPVTLSMDNYYLDRKDSPRHPDGSYDFEAPEALDLPLFNDHLERLINGEKVKGPVFNFVEGVRDPHKTIEFSVGPGQVLLIEGIHALNDRLHENVERRNKYQIFVSALTQLCIDQHNRIFTSDTRLLRRIVRDRLFRGYSAVDTINGWASVRRGEDKNIFPFQESADIMFNSALVYEHAVLKAYAKRFLLEVPQESRAYVEAYRLYKFIDLFLPIFPEEVPRDSVLREFIGGSGFQY